MRAIVSGAGASGTLHALALRAAGVAIAAVFDPDLARAAELASALDARAVTTFGELACVDADVAAVCSPPSVHVDQAEALAAGRRVVFVEKPVATTMDELDRVRALPRAVPIVQWRAGRAVRALRRAIAHGELGEAPAIACDLAWARDDAYFRARRGWGCGALLSIGIHALDAIAWTLGGRIESVSGMTSSREGVAGETAAVAVLGFAGGAMASLRLSLDGGADGTRIVACGRGVTATIEGGEADPTASAVAWSAPTHVRTRLEALERDTRGALGPPLLVPYLGDALAALRDGHAPGDVDALPSIASVADAHAAAMCVAARAPTRSSTRSCAA